MLEIINRNIRVGVSSGKVRNRKAVQPFVPSIRPLS